MKKLILKLANFDKFKTIILVYALVTTGLSIFYLLQTYQKNKLVLTLGSEKEIINKNLNSAKNAYAGLKNQDQYKINQQLTGEINHIHDSYNKLITVYENIQDLKAQKQDTQKLEVAYAASVRDLAELKYASAEADISTISAQINKLNDDMAAAKAAAAITNGNTQPVIASLPVANTPPGSGYSYQQVKTDTGTFPVEIIAADLNSTRVIVDTASDIDCSNNCPVLPLAAYVGRNGAFAGINGSFFCPPEYPSCTGKTNSFDTLLMNKNKHYFNSSNNVYSTVPAAIFYGNTSRFVGRSLEWGRDSGVDAVIAMQPLLVFNEQIVYGGGGSAKYESKGTRSFLAVKGSTVYIGVVHNATMTDSAHVLKILGMQNALNLDEGGSTALWSGGYKDGPGRNIPNAVLFVKK